MARWLSLYSPTLASIRRRVSAEIPVSRGDAVFQIAELIVLLGVADRGASLFADNPRYTITVIWVTRTLPESLDQEKLFFTKNRDAGLLFQLEQLGKQLAAGS